MISKAVTTPARVTKEQKLVRAEAGLQRLAKQLGNVSQARKTLGYICSPARTVTSIHTNRVCREIGSRLDSLQRLTLDNPTQQDRLGSLKLPIGAKLAELKETIDLRSPGLLVPALSHRGRPPAGN